ncbi:MAG: hypothetical protein WC481_08505 [Candidatus Omnitrophota bacterium]
MTDEQINKIAELKRAYVECFSTDAGKKVLEDLESRCFVKSTAYIPGDIYTSVFNEGTRANVLYMKTMISLDIEQIKNLQAEANQ